MKKVKISDEFKVRIKLFPEPAYKLCQKVNVDPNFLSKALNGIVAVSSEDPRILRLAELLNISRDKLFEERSP